MNRQSDLYRDVFEGWRTCAGECRRVLTEQTITPAGPGTLLKDLQTLLDFVGPAGIPTQSHNACLPAARLPELNSKSSCPIQLELKRPLLRDYPNLAGLFVLLRVLDLLQPEGDRLVVPPSALEFWQRLNPTEQYFALLEALFFEARASVLENKRYRQHSVPFGAVVMLLCGLTDQWHTLDDYLSLYYLGPRGEFPTWKVFLLQQLGLVELRPRQPSRKGPRSGVSRGWLIGQVRLTPWGKAVTWALLEFWRGQIQQEAREMKADKSRAPLKAAPSELGILDALLFPPSSSRASAETAEPDEADGDEPEPGGDVAPSDTAPDTAFGTLQPTFQPFYPEWRTVYTRPSRPVRSGTHIFKVVLAGWRSRDGTIWRRLAVPPHTSLDGLASAILSAFHLDNDHLYNFCYRDFRGVNRVYNCPYEEDPPSTTDITVAQTDLALREKMRFTFDYGDDWQFDVIFEAVQDGPCRLHRPKVIKSAGKPPRQYHESDW